MKKIMAIIVMSMLILSLTACVEPYSGEIKEPSKVSGDNSTIENQPSEQSK